MLHLVLTLVLTTSLTPSGGDDTAAINAALAADGVADLAPGTYSTSSTINVNGPKSIIGHGAKINTTATKAFQVNSGAGVTTLTAKLEGFTLACPGGGCQVGIEFGQTVTSPLTGSGTVRDVLISGFDTAGIKTVVTAMLKIEGVTSEYNGIGMLISNGIDNPAVAVRVRDSFFRYNDNQGIKVVAGDNLVFDGNVLEENGLEGVLVQRASGANIALRRVSFLDNYFEDNNTAQVGGFAQFRAVTSDSASIQALSLERNRFQGAAATNRHAIFGKGRFRETDNEYVAPTTGAVTCENTSVCFVAARSDRTPASYWSLPSGTPPVVWEHHGAGVFDVYFNVGGTPTKKSAW